MRIKRTILLASAAVVWLPQMATAQTEPSPGPHRHMMQPGQKAPMTESCEAMMAHHEAMQERMAAVDAELDERVAEMRSASGDAKVEATAAVVEALVEQRKSMHAMMMQHQPRMMRHMMEHMGGMGEGMSGCPMIEKLQGDAETPEALDDERSAHRPG